MKFNFGGHANKIDLTLMPLKIIAFIEDEGVIEKILKHLELWEMKARPPPRAKTPLVTIYLDDSDSQISSPTKKLGTGSHFYNRLPECTGCLLRGLLTVNTTGLAPVSRQ